MEDLLHERGIEISHEIVRYWWNRFGPLFARSGGVADPLRQRCEDVIRSRDFEDQPFFDAAKARAMLDAMVAGDVPANVATSGLLLRVATFSVMQQQFGISA